MSRITPWFFIVLGCWQLFLVLSGRAWNIPQPVSVNVAVGAFGHCALLWGTALLFERSGRLRANKLFMTVAGVAGLGSLAAWAGSFQLGIVMIALLVLPMLVLVLVPRILSRASASNDTRT